MSSPEVTFDYNTQRPRLLIPEYGRHVQRMVEHCMAIEDREARTRNAHAIIQVIAYALLGWFFRPFNRFFAWASERYAGGVTAAIRKSAIMLVLYVGLVALTGWIRSADQRDRTIALLRGAIELGIDVVGGLVSKLEVAAGGQYRSLVISRHQPYTSEWPQGEEAATRLRVALIQARTLAEAYEAMTGSGR